MFKHIEVPIAYRPRAIDPASVPTGLIGEFQHRCLRLQEIDTKGDASAHQSSPVWSRSGRGINQTVLTQTTQEKSKDTSQCICLDTSIFGYTRGSV